MKMRLLAGFAGRTAVCAVCLLAILAATLFPAGLAVAQAPTPTPSNYVERFSLDYSTYLGGSADDSAQDIAAGTDGCAYVVGYALSANFPTAAAYQPSRAASQDAFVARFSPDGSTLVYSTYLGGSGGASLGMGIDLDESGQAYICGYTEAANFPVVTAYQSSLNGYWTDIFAAKLTADGSSLVYSTYLGGSMFDYGYDLAVDGAGSAYVAGRAWSTDFPTFNAYQPSNANSSNYNFILSKLSPDGSSLLYSTYLGGSADGHEYPRVAVDSSGHAYLSGATTSTDFPTLNAYQPVHAGPSPGSWDAVLTKFDPSGSSLVFSTFLGGSEDIDQAVGIALGPDDGVYLTGFTQSDNFPTVNPYQANIMGQPDYFVTRFASDGQSLVYSTYLGGWDWDYGQGIAVDPEGNAWVTGITVSANFPTAKAIQPGRPGGYDATISRFSSGGSELQFSTYLGGSGADYGYTVAVGNDGRIYATGRTASVNFPTADPFQAARGGGDDGFLTRIELLSYYTTPTPTPTPEGYMTPTPSPTATPSPTTSPSPTPSPTLTPSPTASPSPTPSPTPSATPSITPTPFGYKTPTPSPSVTPTPSVPPTPVPVPTGNWSAWTQVNEDGFGNTNNFSAFALACYEGAVYAGTWNNSDGCEIWRRDGPGTTDWTLLTGGGFGTTDNRGAHSLAVFGGELFVGTANNTDGFEVWSYDGSSWTRRANGGLGDSANTWASAMVVHDGKLYLGTSWQGAVFTYDWSEWTQVNENYFGDSNNQAIRSLAVYDGKVYAGVYNATDYGRLYRYDGPGAADWTLVTEGGFGDNFVEFRSLAAAGPSLFVGGAGWSVSCQVWEYAGGQFARNDPGDDMQYDAARVMEVFDNRLYVGTGNDSGSPSGGQVWEYGWGAWTQVNENGFGDTTNEAIHSLAGCYPCLFAGVANSDGQGGRVFMRCAITPPPTPTSSPTPLTPTPTPAPTLTPQKTATPAPTLTPRKTPSPTPAPSASPTPTCGPVISPDRAVIASGDYDGDGTADLAVFRPNGGMWSVRDLTVAYYGLSNDVPAPGDYDGDGTAEISVFRSASGQWFVRNLTRITYGQSGDIPAPADYDGVPGAEIALFRPATGRWYVHDLTSFAFGASGDWPVPADYDAGGSALFAVYRPAGGYWAVSSLTRFFFGGSNDWPLALDYNGDGASDPAVFRPCEGMWSIRGITRHYIGICTDWARPGDYDGNGADDLAIFRDYSSLWAVREMTRVYFGGTGDVPVTR